MYLDEPTTGLDSKSALDIGKLLRSMAQGGRTLLSTIHQPSSELLHQFDKVLILNKGQIIYDGPPSSMEFYFRSIGFPAPVHTNPADHVMAILIRDEALKEQFHRSTTLFNRRKMEANNRKLNILIASYHKSICTKKISEEM